jgi:hypothetical protein
MSFIAAAVIGGVGALGAGYLASQGAQSAASTQAQGQEQAAATQQGMFNTVNQQEQPFIQAGYGATQGLNQLMGLQPGTSNTGGLANGYLTQQFSPQSFVNTPQYQFQQQQGGQAIRNADTPGLGALSGAALKDLMNYNQGLASTYYGNYFNMQQQQQQNIFSRLSGLAGLGQNAATQVGTAGTSLGTGVAQAQAGAAGSQAAGAVGSANAWSSALNNGAAYLQLGSLMSGNVGNTGPGTGAYTYAGQAYNNPSAYLAGGG